VRVRSGGVRFHDAGNERRRIPASAERRGADHRAHHAERLHRFQDGDDRHQRRPRVPLHSSRGNRPTEQNILQGLEERRRLLAEAAPAPTAQELEARRLEEEEPGLLHVKRNDDGSIIL
jgi:hypothetical protein